MIKYFIMHHETIYLDTARSGPIDLGILPFALTQGLRPPNQAHITRVPDIKRDQLAQASAIYRRGGDGTTSYTINELLHLVNEGLLDELPPIVLLGGGSADTLLKALINMPQPDKIPDNIKNQFPTNTYQVREYYPPKLVYQGEDDEIITRYIDYLAGFGHLSQASCRVKESVAKLLPKLTSKHPQDAYMAAGIASLFMLPWKIQPKQVSYSENGKLETIKGKKIIAAESIGVPILGTFTFSEAIKPDQLRLLTLTAENDANLYKKYVLALIIGGLLHNGPDRLIKSGIIDARDVKKIVIMPDCQADKNCVIDGDLDQIKGPVIITRSPYKLYFVIPNELISPPHPKT